MPDSEKREAFIETRQVGSILRITAIDAETGTEAIFQAPVNTPPADLQRMAMKKLAYVMRRQEN